MEKYVELVADITHDNVKQVKEQMDFIQRKYGLTYKEYHKNELYLLSVSELHKKAAKIQRRKEKRNEAFAKILRDSGMTRKEVIENIKKLNEKNILKINVLFFEKFNLYRMNEKEQEETLHLIAQRNALRDALLSDFQRVDRGELSYTDLEEKIALFYDMVERLSTPEFHEKLKDIFVTGRDCNTFDESQLRKIVIDMEVSRMILGFSFPEYVCFHFERKSLAERRTYISNKERMQVLGSLNTEEGSDLLNNKVECYRLLEKYYGRKQVYIQKSEDYPQFENFCRRRKVFVKKSVALSMGKGIEPIYIDKKTDLKALMEEFLTDSGSFAAEELISIHKKIKKLNPTSVNTVRVETFFDGEKTVIRDVFMRIGQSGAFVDNAGAGGIFVSVDPQTGIINSNGFDEYGNTYMKHPDTGVAFKGYRLPGWKKALRLCIEISDKVPGVKFIGWDIAYTSRRKWVIVEGNAKPQIICNQTSQEKGLKKTFLQCVNMEK